MKNNVQLSIFNESMPGLDTAYRFTITGPETLRDLTIDEFKAVDQMYQIWARIDSWTLGWLISVYIEIQRRSSPSSLVAALIHDYSEVRGFDFDECVKKYNVYQFYPPSVRISGLSWYCYCTVYEAGIRPVDAAIQWLKRCKANNWTRAKLREELRAGSVRPVNQEPQVPGFFPPELQRTEDWCSGQLHCVEQMPNDAAERLLECMAGTVQFIDALRAKVAQPVAGG